MRTILFVCTGNTCRSPLAEAVARQWIREEGLTGELFAASAGIAAQDGGPLASETVRALEKLGIEHHGSAKAVSANMIRKADVVFCMTEQHAEAARDLIDDDPDHQSKISRLDPEQDLEDPAGMGQNAYDRLAKQLQSLVPKRLKEWLAREDRTRIGSPR